MDKVNVKNVFLILISIFVASYVVILSNAEIKYLLSNDNIDYVDIITSFRYSRFMTELPLIFNRNSEVKYFEMDLIDLYLAAGFPGIISLGYLYYNVWFKLEISFNRILLVGLITYSFLFGHVLMSTSFGLLILSSKYLKNEHVKKYL